VPAQ
jgi:hypothetical protein